MLVFPLLFSTLSFKPLKRLVSFQTLSRLAISLCIVFMLGFYLYVLLASNLDSKQSQVITMILAGSICTFSLLLTVASLH